jgi:hypothetical protein
MAEEGASREHEQPESVPERPRAVGAASVLWILLGAMLILASLRACAGGGGLYSPRDINPLVVLIVVALGTVFISLGRAIRRGSASARTGLTVIGGLFSVFMWPLVFTVPAIILQFLPSANAWFTHIQALRNTNRG